MNNFILQISISFVLGFLFLILAREHKKQLFVYFCIGFFSSFFIRFLYLLIYGIYSDFLKTTGYNSHKQYSIIVSIIATYILYRIMKQKIKKDKEKQKAEIEDIGKD